MSETVERVEPLPMTRDELLAMRDRVARVLAIHQGVVGGVKPEQVRQADVAVGVVLSDVRRMLKQR